MNKLMNGLGTIVLALSAGCAVPQPVEGPRAPQKLDNVAINAFEEQYRTMRADNKISPVEARRIAEGYNILKSAELVEGANPDTVQHRNRVRDNLYGSGFNEVFNNMDIYVVLSGMASEELKNGPANIGAVRKVYVGKGIDVAGKLTEDKRIELYQKAREQWNPLPVTSGHVLAGGGRIVGWECCLVEIKKDIMEQIIGKGVGVDGPGQKRVSDELWKQVTDGDKSNGEMKRYFITAVGPMGYNVPAAPAEK